MLLQAIKTGLLHSYAAAATTVIYALRRFFETIDLLVLKRDHYNKETKIRKSLTNLITRTLMYSTKKGYEAA